MAGLPVIVGAIHDTSSLVVGVVVLAATVGAAGAPGGSFTSVTLMVTAMVSSAVAVFSVLPLLSLPSLAFTVTLYEVLAS